MVLPNDTRIFIDEAFLYPGAERNLLTFKDISRSGCHIITTACESGTEYLDITESETGFTFSVGKTEISVIFFVFGEHRDTNFGPESL